MKKLSAVVHSVFDILRTLTIKDIFPSGEK